MHIVVASQVAEQYHLEEIERIKPHTKRCTQPEVWDHPRPLLPTDDDDIPFPKF